MPQQGGQTVRHESYLMIMSEESESRGREELDDMNDARKEIHLKRGTDTSDIFGYMDKEEPEQVALAVVEDRRKNISQFDLAYIDVDGQEVLAAFDTCSTTTLIHRELVEGGKIKVTETQDDAEISGIGGVTKGRVVTLELFNRSGTMKIIIKASVVDEITTLRKKDKNRFDLLTRESVDAIKHKKGYEDVTKENFQQVPGGKIQMLLGQDIGQDFFPKEIATYTCGLKISEHRIKLFDMKRYLGFSGSFPAHFVTMYSLDDHPKTLLLQVCPQQLKEEEELVFRKLASAKTQR